MKQYLRRALEVALFTGFVVGVFAVGLPRVADLHRVWRIIGSMTAAQTAILVGLAALNLVTYWPVVMASLPGLSLGQAAVVNQSSTSVAMTVPGGGAIAVGVTYAMLTSWGFRRSEIALSAVISGIWTNLVKLLMPALALIALAVRSEPGVADLSTAVLGLALVLSAVVILRLLLRSERFARRLGEALAALASGVRRLFRRPPLDGWGRRAALLRAQARDLVRRRWLSITVATLVSQLTLFAVLLAALRFVGIPESVIGSAQALAVFAVVRVASAVPILPGNVGIAELGYIAGLVLAGGPRAPVVAAVVVFRGLTFFAQIPVGAITYLVWKRKRSWRRARPAERPAGALRDSVPIAP